jgi:hypothetical protein
MSPPSLHQSFKTEKRKKASAIGFDSNMMLGENLEERSVNDSSLFERPGSRGPRENSFKKGIVRPSTRQGGLINPTPTTAIQEETAFTKQETAKFT